MTTAAEAGQASKILGARRSESMSWNGTELQGSGGSTPVNICCENSAFWRVFGTNMCSWMLKRNIEAVHCDLSLLQSRTTVSMLRPVTDYWGQKCSFHPTSTCIKFRGGQQTSLTRRLRRHRGQVIRAVTSYLQLSETAKTSQTHLNAPVSTSCS